MLICLQPTRERVVGPLAVPDLELGQLMRDSVHGNGIDIRVSDAEARHIEVVIGYHPREFRLSVRDNGKGIDSKVLQDSRVGHYGIPGMRERTRLAGGRLVFWGELHFGTELELTIPATLAYMKESDSDSPTLAARTQDIFMISPIRLLRGRQSRAFTKRHRNNPREPARHELGCRSLERPRSRRPISNLPSRHHPHGFADARDERSRCDGHNSGGVPDARIIMLTTYIGDVRVLRAMKAGARGYLLKTLLDRELLETIRAVHDGRKMLSAEASY
jgi:CheY-like chemotaxis protein